VNGLVRHPALQYGSQSRDARGLHGRPEIEIITLQPEFALTGIAVETSSADHRFRPPEIHVTGMNSALQRAPRIDASPVPLIGRAGFVPRWKPYWPKIKTFGLTFPAGLEFLPQKEEKQQDELRSIETPKPSREGGAKKKATRIQPPADALSIEDRLFYVLQPPLESWLRGQELIMPFEPFPYQYEGIAWIFSQDAALLADEMGLGKTMQTITALRLLLRAGKVRRVLMICPKPLIPNWQREFNLWAEEIPVTTVEGDSARRQMIWQMPGSTVLLANYELVVRDFQAMHPEDVPNFDLVVLDEAQRIKNRDSVTAQTMHAIPRKRSLCLTGTPIENRAEEMISLFEFMGVIPAHASPDLRQLSSLSEEYILRRTKDLVMTDMPPRLDRDEVFELSPAQQHSYNTAEKEGVIQLNGMGESITIQHVFELVLRLKQICNYDPLTGESAKLDRLVADMEEISASGGKAILFSQWTRTLDWLEERTRQFGCLVYHGGVPTKKREPILSRFKEDPDSHLLLMSYGTGAVGLNLQFAGYVFLYDRWWNPAVEDQAINRAHRIGQKSQVIVSKFISKNTIEERIDLVLRQKRELFARVLGEGDNENASLSLTAGEIFGLFDLKARSGNDAKPVGPGRSNADAA
jgi:SNF2 family DNA or RNA helicase